MCGHAQAGTLCDRAPLPAELLVSPELAPVRAAFGSDPSNNPRVASKLNKDEPAPDHYIQAAMRWVEMTVALSMVHASEALSHEERRRRTQEIVGRWRGNRGETWQPTIRDMDSLIESTITWAGARVRPRFEGWNV